MNRIKSQVLSGKWIFFIIISCVYAVCQKNIIMYSVFLIQFFILFINLCKQEYRKVKENEIELLFVSLLMPDNYLVIAVVGLLLVIHLPLGKWKTNLLTVISCSYILLNTIINNVHFTNLFFSVLYNLPFLLSAYLIKKKVDREENCKEIILVNIKRFIVLEGSAVVFYMVSHLQLIKTFIDMDWVTGTLGTYQCNTLMIIASFSFLVFLDEYLKRKKDLIWAVVSLGMAMSTTSVAYTLVLIVTVIIALFLADELKLKTKVIAIIGMGIGCVIFLFVSPQWIVDEIPKLTQFSYLQQRVHKLEYYKNTFYEIPENEGVYTWLFGSGIGEYSSRAASTCAGGYVGFYDNYFPIQKSELRVKYITDQTYDVAFWGKSVVDTPGSSIIAIQGELGIIGLLIYIASFIRLYRKSNGVISKIIVIYFFGLMFVESVMGFLKYGLIFWIAYWTVNQKQNLEYYDEGELV